MAQHKDIPSMSQAAYSQSEVYTFVQAIGNYVHEGRPVTAIIIKAHPSGHLYRTYMPSEEAGRAKEGDEVLVFPSELP